MTQTTAERQHLVDRLAEIDAEEREALEPLLHVIEKGESEVEGARASLLVAELELAEARFAETEFN